MGSGIEVSRSGFREIEHTADWELEVWAPDFTGLLEQAALGMYHLSGIRIAQAPIQEFSLEIDFTDRESALVKFLSELLYLASSENWGALRFDLQLTKDHLRARLTGAPILSLGKEIKAVTYHRLHIHEMIDLLSVRLVFDV